MTCRLLVILASICYVGCEVRRGDEAPDSSRLMGVDTVHDIKIDKDTIISRNLIMDKKYMKRTAPPPTYNHQKTSDVDRDPDWSYSPIPPEVSEHVSAFKRNMTECLKEVQANDKRTVKRMSPKMESPVHGECLIACVMKRNGVIEKGKIHKENLITLVSKFYAKDTHLMKKLEKNLDRCLEISAHERSECELAARLNECTNGLMASNKHKITVNY